MSATSATTPACSNRSPTWPSRRASMPREMQLPATAEYRPAMTNMAPRTEAASGDRDQHLLRIATGILRLETLDVRNGDSLDFHDLSVWQIRQALEAAY